VTKQLSWAWACRRKSVLASWLGACRRASALTAGVAVLVAAACGGETDDSAGPACAFPGACGGDVVGTWEVEDVCFGSLDAEAPLPACGRVPPEVTFRKVSGFAEFRADGTAEMELGFTMQVVHVYDADCIRALGGRVAPSASYCQTLGEEMDRSYREDPDSSYASVECTYRTDACHCTYVSKPLSEHSAGSYTVNGTTLVDNHGDVSDFCVRGDQLNLLMRGDSADIIVMLQRR
jgi:hypothetical protein